MSFESVKQIIKKDNKTWLVTGAAGFIGSHLVVNLLHLNQNVVAIDNFSGGSKENLEAIENSVGAGRYLDNFRFVEGDICNFESCQEVCQGVDYVLHHAALCSVPLSLENPLDAHASNVTGTLNLMWSSVLSQVERFVYASSSSVYGDSPSLPHREERTGVQFSPYAIDKYVCELYAKNFFDAYKLESIGLRYFNIFGPRQSVDGTYAAVIPSFARDILKNEAVQIYGDGKTSRDFCYIDNVVQANLLSAITDSRKCFGQVFNVSCSEQISILRLYHLVKNHFIEEYPDIEIDEAVHRDFRSGDVKHSLGDISKITTMMGYRPSHLFAEGLAITLDWYMEEFKK